MRGQDALDMRDGYIRTRWLRSISPTNPDLSVFFFCREMLGFSVCGVKQNLYVFSLYRNHDLDDWIFDYLLASMAAAQAEDIRASFLFVGDLNGVHQEWLD